MAGTRDADALEEWSRGLRCVARGLARGRGAGNRRGIRTRASAQSALTGELHAIFTLSLGDAPLALMPDLVAALSVVPLRDGVFAELDGQRAVLTPDDLLAFGMLERGVVTPIPESGDRRGHESRRCGACT